MPDPGSMRGGAGLVIALSGYRGLRQIGGPLRLSGVCFISTGAAILYYLPASRRRAVFESFAHSAAYRPDASYPSFGADQGHSAWGQVNVVPRMACFLCGQAWVGIFRAVACILFTEEAALDVVAWHPTAIWAARR